MKIWIRTARDQFHVITNPISTYQNGGKILDNITLDEIIGLHATLLANDGEDLRIISEGNLHQLVFRINAQEDLVDKAATAFWSLCAYPAFREGNRRTACHLAEIILGGGSMRKKLPCEEMRVLAKGIDSFTIEIEDVVQVLRSHFERTPGIPPG